MEETKSRKEHWENIYNSKELKDVSWYQALPETSLNFFKEFKVAKDAAIIDVGGGDSLLVDHLIQEGYTDISVLDISEKALERAKLRLGEKAKQVKWIVSDASEFKPERKYDFWHDRAAFHFFATEDDIEKYIKIVKENINPEGILILGTFSESGPKKCSGIEIKQYSEETMKQRLLQYFEKVKCFHVEHNTPFNTIQNFIFCSFRKN